MNIWIVSMFLVIDNRYKYLIWHFRLPKASVFCDYNLWITFEMIFFLTKKNQNEMRGWGRLSEMMHFIDFHHKLGKSQMWQFKGTNSSDIWCAAPILTKLWLFFQLFGTIWFFFLTNLSTHKKYLLQNKICASSLNNQISPPCHIFFYRLKLLKLLAINNPLILIKWICELNLAFQIFISYG